MQALGIAYEDVKEAYLTKSINYETFLKSVEAINKNRAELYPEADEFLVCEPVDFTTVTDSIILTPNEMANNTAIYKVAIDDTAACGMTPMIALQRGYGKYEIQVTYLGRNTSPIFSKRVGEQLNEILSALQKLVDEQTAKAA